MSQDDYKDSVGESGTLAAGVVTLTGALAGFRTFATAGHTATNTIPVRVIQLDANGAITYGANYLATYAAGSLTLGAPTASAATGAPSSGAVEVYEVFQDTEANRAKAWTTTLETKLNGIEELADVTDATNVNAAGATMNTDTDVSGNSWVLDEDDLVSDSATKVPTQQSVKAYVDGFKYYTVGTSFPTPLGDGHAHYRPDRLILYLYEGSAWQPIESFGDITLYVENGQSGEGFGSGSDALGNMQDAFDAIPALLGGNVIVNVGIATATTISGDGTLSGKTFKTPGYIHIVGQMISAGAAVLISSHTANHTAGGTPNDYGLLIQSASTIPDADFYTYPSESWGEYWVAKRLKPSATEVKLAGKQEASTAGFPATPPSAVELTTQNASFAIGGSTTIQGFDCATTLSGAYLVAGGQNVHISKLEFSQDAANNFDVSGGSVTLTACKFAQSGNRTVLLRNNQFFRANGCQLGRTEAIAGGSCLLYGCFMTSSTTGRTCQMKNLGVINPWTSTIENTAATAASIALWAQLGGTVEGSNNVLWNASTSASAYAFRAETNGGVKGIASGYQMDRGAGGTAYSIDTASGGWSS